MRSSAPSSSGASVSDRRRCRRSVDLLENVAAAVGRKQTIRRLRAPEIVIDEVAFQVGRQHSCRQFACGALRATFSSTSRSAAGAHATVVGQNAVTPYFGRRRAICAIASPPSSVSIPSVPCTCTSINRAQSHARATTRWRRRVDVDDSVALQHERAGRQHAGRQQKIGAGQNDHGR